MLFTSEQLPRSTHLLLVAAAAVLLALLSPGQPGTRHGVLALPAAAETNMGMDIVKTNWASSIGTGMWLIEFFSPYCHHCQKFAPTWGALAEMHGHLADSHNFHLARVNCVAQGDICKSQEIKGYPTIRLYADGKALNEYDDDRSYEKLSEFILSRASDYRKAHAKAPIGVEYENNEQLGSPPAGVENAKALPLKSNL